ncbi:MAG: AAA family ATPase, partial [Solirubrobacterales bacterium]|nr:AAA family ATPase [Solirubrobacterales bacterium]
MTSIRAPALVERERELEVLHEGLERASAGEGTLILVEGPAGVGKTELTREARASAERAGVLALAAKGSELEQPFAFGVVRQLLDPVITEASGRGDLFAGAAGPAARLFVLDEQPPPAAEASFASLHSLYWLLVNLTDQGPVLVAVDDCQWVDLDSLRFLAYLAERVDGLPVALLLAGRRPATAPQEAETIWGQILSLSSAVMLHPRPLSPPAALAIARQRLGADAAEEFGRACHGATGGNPLFLRELLRALHAAGVAPSAAAASGVQAVGPTAVSRFVLHRLAALGAAAGELARTVAVLGDGSELALAGEVLGMGEAAARAAADDLVRADIFVASERLGFVHPIVRAALYEDLAPGERQARHAAAAAALTERGASPERITAQLLLTNPTGDQHRVRILRAAAADAARRGAPAVAGVRLRRALAESPAEPERSEILTELGRNEVAAMEFEAAEQHLQAALRSSGNPTVRARAASALGRCAIVAGGRSAQAAVQALQSLAQELGPVDQQRSLELGSELLLVSTAVPPLRAGLAERLEDFARRARGHPGFEAVAHIYRAHETLVLGGSARTAVAEVQSALAAGLPPATVTSAGLMAVQTLRLAEHYELALRLLDLALDGARREGHTARQGLIHGHRAAIALARGSLQDAQVEAETGLRLVQAPHFGVLQLAAVAIVVLIERGALTAAAELAPIGEGRGIGEDRAFTSEFLVARGRLRIAQGHVREGVDDLLWCGERLEALNAPWPGDWRAYAAPALAALGETHTATRLAHEQLETARRVGTTGALGLSLRAAGLAIGGDERLGYLQEAVSVLESSAARLELAHALADLGAELSRVGRRKEGRDARRKALELAHQCGAIALADRALAELQAGPGRPTRTELTGPNALTAAEWQVCRQA